MHRVRGPQLDVLVEDDTALDGPAQRALLGNRLEPLDLLGAQVDGEPNVDREPSRRRPVRARAARVRWRRRRRSPARR
jgi:hypothetical protein